MPRARSAKGEAATELMSEYYVQTATAGLIISEGTQTVARDKAMPGLPESIQPNKLLDEKSNQCRSLKRRKNIRLALVRWPCMAMSTYLYRNTARKP